MKNSLFQKKSRSITGVLPVFAFFAIVLFFLVCVNTIDKNSRREATIVLKEAVSKAAVQCYAIEGQYPDTVEYLEQQYGLNYNHDKFTVHYEKIGANLMPDIFITRSEKNG